MFIVIYRTNYITLSYHVKFHFKNLANSFQVTDNFIIEKYEQKIQKMALEVKGHQNVARI